MCRFLFCTPVSWLLVRECGEGLTDQGDVRHCRGSRGPGRGIGILHGSLRQHSRHSTWPQAVLKTFRGVFVMLLKVDGWEGDAK